MCGVGLFGVAMWAKNELSCGQPLSYFFVFFAGNPCVLFYLRFLWAMTVKFCGRLKNMAAFLFSYAISNFRRVKKSMSNPCFLKIMML